MGATTTDLETFATTVPYGDVPEWDARAWPVLDPLPARYGLRDGIRAVRMLLRASRRVPALLLDSTNSPAHPDLAAAAILSLRRRRPVVVMIGDMWQRDRGLRGRLQRLLVRRADRVISLYAVQSRAEARLLPDTWGVSPDKVRYAPYFATFKPEDLDGGIPNDGHVFAGGDSHRDYGPLVEAARRLPHIRFVAATSLLDDQSDLPPNLQAGRLPQDEFVRMLRSAAVAVVAVRSGLTRAAGQQTLLNAMRLRKPTIVTEVPGMSDHARAGESALFVDGTADSYVEALEWLFDPANREDVDRIRAEAQRTSLPFTYEQHVKRILAILDEALATAG